MKYFVLAFWVLFSSVIQAQEGDPDLDSEVNNSPSVSDTCGSRNSDRGITGFIFSSDQDFLNVAGPNRDANYTMGAQFLWMGEGTNNRLLLGLPYFLSGIDQLIFGQSGGALSTRERVDGKEQRNVDYLRSVKYQFAFGVSAFTPEDLTAVAPVTNDRPYSSTLFFKSGRVYGSNLSKWMLETSLTLDVLGLHISEFVQTGIHEGQRINDSTARPNPLGWDNQISNGFGLSGSYEAMGYYAFLHDTKYQCSWFTPYVGMGGSVGTYTRARGTVGFAIGGFSGTEDQSIPSFFNVNIGRQQKAMEDLDSASTNYSSRWPKWKGFDIVFDAQGHFDAWGYNALLQGLPWSNDAYTLTGSEIERFTFMWNVNMTVRLNTTYLRFGLGGRTKEFRKSGALPHGWGTVAFGWML